MRPARAGRHVAIRVAALLWLWGCAGVTVVPVHPKDYVAEQRGDILSTGRLSASTTEALRMLGIGATVCPSPEARCREALAVAALLGDDQRLSALAELWLQQALRLAEPGWGRVDPDAVRDAYLEAARYAYAYLFFTARRPSERAFEDRQTQVRDYYNFAEKEAITLIFPRYRGAPRTSPMTLREGVWNLHVRFETGRDGEQRLPQELIQASALVFTGIRSVYRRDGFGAEMLAVLGAPANADRPAEPFTESRIPTATAVLSFHGATLVEVLGAHEIDLVVYDPYRFATVPLGGSEVPLAANFTAGYGVWLARSGFSWHAVRTVLGRAKGLQAPHVYLMQPFDPNRRIIVLLHGLASSPEAWINVANEVLGDEALRRRFQVWQVVYPTNAPIAYNHRHIRTAVERTLKHFDPTGTAPASSEIVLVGHSMGGVLARLMVSASGDAVVPAFVAERELDGAQLDKVYAEFGPYLTFEPMPQVRRAVFIAAPHRGTPFAENRLARWVASLVRLPADIVTTLTHLNQSLADGADGAGPTPIRVSNSIENLSEKALFLRLADTMPIAPAVEYHSIIGNNTPGRPLEDSNDGVVPYRSAHLDGAASEKVIASWHDVQETPEAILELRRILRAP